MMQPEETDFLNNTLNLATQYISASPENAENGLVALVLSLVELIRKLIEKQAMRRILEDDLPEEQVERLGLTLMRLEQKMEELKKHFNLTDKDLEIFIGGVQTIN